MPQVAAWYQLSGQPWFTVVECPRRDCEQRAKAYNIDGPWKPWEGPVPTGSLAQLVLEERPFMEALLMQWNHARTLAEEWTQEHRDGRSRRSCASSWRRSMTAPPSCQQSHSERWPDRRRDPEGLPCQRRLCLRSRSQSAPSAKRGGNSGKISRLGAPKGLTYGENQRGASSYPPPPENRLSQNVPRFTS
jgi:hypothetical protein